MLNDSDNENMKINNEIETGVDETISQSDEGRHGFFELIYGTIFNPVGTFRGIANDPPVFYGFLIFISVVVITSLTSIILPQDMGDIPPELGGVMTQAGPALVIVGAMMSMVFWFIQAGIFQVIGELLGGHGRAVGVLTVLALAGIPGIVLIPFQVLSYFLAESWAGTFLTIAGSILAFIWWAVLLVLGIREIHRFSTGRAVLTVITPFAGIILILIITVISLFALIAPLINNLP